MKMLRLMSMLLLLAMAGFAGAQERRYSEGAVTEVTSVKIMDGQSENYMNYLANTWKRSMEASKAAGIVSNYAVYSASPRRPEDADLYLVTTYPNMAAFDGMAAKMDPVMAKVMKMDLAQREQAAGKRTIMRTILGSELIREMILK